MGRRLGKAVVPLFARAHSRSKHKPLPSPEYSRPIEGLLEAAPEHIATADIALLNLLCAPNLPGSEMLDIRQCLGRLDRLSAFVKDSTARCYPAFLNDPHWGHSEPMWRMALLVTRVKHDYGAAYDPVVRAELDRDGHSPFVDSRNVFLHRERNRIAQPAGHGHDKHGDRRATAPAPLRIVRQQAVQGTTTGPTTMPLTRTSRNQTG